MALIDEAKYYTLDAITEWCLDEEGQRKADLLAAHRGRSWKEELDNKGTTTTLGM